MRGGQKNHKPGSKEAAASLETKQSHMTASPRLAVHMKSQPQ